MSRSKWKGPFLDKKVFKVKKSRNKRIWARNSIIPKKLLRTRVLVHTGKYFHPVFITPEKIGFKFGEFSYTRKKKKRDSQDIKKNKKPEKNKATSESKSVNKKNK